MEKEMTLISAKGKLKGIWGEAVNPIEGITPLVILAKTGDKDQAYWLSRYLNDAGILTFTFEADDAASATRVPAKDGGAPAELALRRQTAAGEAGDIRCRFRLPYEAAG